jgi:hypothetical protein
MDDNILIALIKGEPISQELIESACYDMCEHEHSSCNSACLVYALNGNASVNAHRPFKENRGCDCFKNGKAIFNFIKNSLTKI